MKFATAAKAEEVPHFSLVSSYGASPTSWVHYAKTKGQVKLLAQTTPIFVQ